jgi:hypothetical protein
MNPFIAFFCLVLAACAAAPQAPAPQAIPFDANLWQAARETVSFLPEGAADPVSGTLETGWGEAKPHARDRYKIVIALDYSQPYTAAAQVTVHHEIKNGENWMDVADDAEAAPKFEQEIARAASALRQAKKAA